MNTLGQGKRIFRGTELYLTFILLGIIIVVGSINKTFLSLESLFDLLKSASIIGIFACGFLLVLISGGIDVSFAAIATVAMYVTTSILNVIGGNIFTAFLLSIAIGIALGLLNALVITYFKIPTLITTLGTMNIFHGMLLVIGRTAHISVIPISIVKFGEASIFRLSVNRNIESGLSYLSIVMIAVFFITWFILRYTKIGRGIYAIGSNYEAARRVGFNVNAIQIFVYCYIGMLSGVAGLVNVSLMRYVNSFDLVGTELSIIGAVALGGASISGGKGSVLGTALGAGILLVIRNCLVLIGIPSSWQALMVGVIILASISLANLRKDRKGN
jgi:simple sugar transport system permease protein